MGKIIWICIGVLFMGMLMQIGHNSEVRKSQPSSVIVKGTVIGTYQEPGGFFTNANFFVTIKQDHDSKNIKFCFHGDDVARKVALSGVKTGDYFESKVVRSKLSDNAARLNTDTYSTTFHWFDYVEVNGVNCWN